MTWLDFVSIFSPLTSMLTIGDGKGSRDFCSQHSWCARHSPCWQRRRRARRCWGACASCCASLPPDINIQKIIFPGLAFQKKLYTHLKKVEHWQKCEAWEKTHLQSGRLGSFWAETLKNSNLIFSPPIASDTYQTEDQCLQGYELEP